MGQAVLGVQVPGVSFEVVEGTWDGAVFSSDTMLVKHDEQYQTDYEDYDENKHACDEA